MHSIIVRLPRVSLPVRSAKRPPPGTSTRGHTQPNCRTGPGIPAISPGACDSLRLSQEKSECRGDANLHSPPRLPRETHAGCATHLPRESTFLTPQMARSLTHATRTHAEQHQNGRYPTPATRIRKSQHRSPTAATRNARRPSLAHILHDSPRLQRETPTSAPPPRPHCHKSPPATRNHRQTPNETPWPQIPVAQR